MNRKTHCIKGHLREASNITSSGGCYQCHKDYNRSDAGKLSRLKWRKKNPHKFASYYRKSDLKLKYGLSTEQHRQILLKQNNSCAICLFPQEAFLTPLCVDHDHKTGRVRGLLCNKCNAYVLPLIENTPGLVENAKNYLKF